MNRCVGSQCAAAMAKQRDAEQRILQLTGSDDNNQPILTPFKHEATAPVKPDSPRRRT